MSAVGNASAAASEGTGRTRVELCGTLRVEIRGRDVTAAIPSRQGRALLAYLVLNRHRGVTRDELIDALWPQDPPGSPGAGLSSVLARLRGAVGPGVVDGRSQLFLRLDDDAEIDLEIARRSAERGLRALHAGDPGGALEIATAGVRELRGPPLPDLDQPWVEAARAEAGDVETDLLVLRARAGLALGGGELAAAERDARAVVRRAPYLETGFALLIEALARRGDVAEAMRTFDTLRVRLREELGTAPEPRVTALHEQLLHHGRLAPDVAPPPADTVVPLPAAARSHGHRPFVGRNEALATLHAAWEGAEAGAGQLVFVSGQSGVGKTRLAMRFAEAVHARGGTVLHGLCDEELIVPYQPFVEALRQYLEHAPSLRGAGLGAELHALGRLIPRARSLAGEHGAPPADDPQLERYFLFDAVAAVLGEAARSRPVLVVLDDLQWADRPTLLLLRHVARRLDAGRGVMLLATFRVDDAEQSAELQGIVADLRREHACGLVRLEGLGAPETAALVAARARTPPTPEFVRALRAETAGNPFFVEETLRSLADAGALEGAGALPEQALERMGVPDGVEAVITRRLARVSAGAAETLRLASAVGREFDVRTLADASGESGRAVLRALAEAVQAGLVAEPQEGGASYAFCHALVRRAVYAGLGRPLRVQMHERIARALEAREDAAAAELAHHFALALELTGPEPAIRFAIRAAEAAARALAYEDADQHYGRALGLWEQRAGDHEGERCRLLLAQGRVRWKGGASQGARAAYLAAAASARRRGSADQLARAALGLGERYWEAKATDVAYRELLVEALDVLPDADGPLRARVLARLAENLHFTDEQEHGAQLSAEAVAMARRLGDRSALVTALMARHVVLLHVEHLEQRLALLDEVVALGEGYPEIAAEARQWRLYALCELGDLGAARRTHSELVALATELHQPLFHHVATAWESVFALLDGDVGRAEELAADAYRLGRQANAADAGSVRGGQLFNLRRWQGRSPELPALIAALEEPVRAMPSWRAAIALARLETGDVERGRAGYERFAARGFSGIPRDFFWLGNVALATEAACALGDTSGAESLYALLSPYAARCVQVSFAACWGSVERYLGILAATMGDLDRSERHLRVALARAEAMAAPPLVAATQCDLGDVLARRGGASAAVVVRAQAARTARACGLTGLERRASS